MQLFHDSRDARYRSPGGARPCGTPLRLCLRVTGGIPEGVYLRQWFGKESFTPMRPDADDATLYVADVVMPQAPCLLWYDFQVWEGGQFHWYGNAMDALGGEGAPIWGEARSYQVTVYDPAFCEPEWTRGAVFYQIFPDRFARGSQGARLPMPPGRMFHEDWHDTPALMVDPDTGDNVAHDFFGGTLLGIREKLPYLRDLGVTVLYLNPIFFAKTNHRFDTSDWKQIDPALGTQADFEALCADAAEMGMHVILDGVFSHSGDGNAMFRHARSAADSPYRSWYRFEHWPDMYKSWWGFKTLPELNKYQPEVIDYFLTDEDAVVKKWVRDGADGWRIDVADELPMPYLRMLRRAVRGEKAQPLVIGEVWEDASHKVAYGDMRCYCLGDTLDGVMNYPLREAAIGFLTGALDAAQFKRLMDSLYENYPAPFARSLMNVMGSHDRARALNVLSEAEGSELSRAEQSCHTLTPAQRALGKRRLKLLLHLTVAMPGIPCVYYGDEAGMEGCSDPFSRGPFPWDSRDEELTAYFTKVLARRREMDILSDGGLQIEAFGGDVLCIHRTLRGKTVTTLINRGEEPQEVVAGGRAVVVEALEALFWAE